MKAPRPPSSADPLTYLFSLEQYGIKHGLSNIRTLTAAFDQQVKAAMKRAGVASKKDVDALKKEIERLKKSATSTRAATKKKTTKKKKTLAKKKTKPAAKKRTKR